MIGPAGIITKSGRNVQLTEDLRLVVPTRAKRSPTGYKDSRGTIGTAGIHRPDGSTELFTHDFAHDILLIGPAGIVTKSGRNIQISEDLRLVVPGLPATPSRKKRSPTSYKDSRGIIGTAGILRKDGSTELFTHEFAHDILLIGPAGIITKSGRNLQLTDDFRLVTPVLS
ncbi:cuticle protein CP1158-like [Macrobrachium rosenbergii]|uniref:cuticle protein CP1158-like n=1 Tax=Macrobrachium rosenbergii TaxID=79674 RepID=UPI0034D73697